MLRLGIPEYRLPRELIDLEIQAILALGPTLKLNQALGQDFTLAELRRDFDTLEVSQQCTIVIAQDEATAQQHLEKAKKVYGGHMGGAIEEHGIWGAPEQVIERIQRHVDLGCTLFIIEFFGRDTREPARIFAEEVFHAFA